MTKLMGGTLGAKAVTLGDFDDLLDLANAAGLSGGSQELYASVAWTFWATNLRANAVADTPYRIYPLELPEEDEDEDSAVEFALDLTEVLWPVEAWLTLRGAAYVLKRRGRRTDGVMALQVLNANTMRPILRREDSDGPVLFRQQIGGQQIDWPARDIVYFRSWSPSTDWLPGVAPGQVAEVSGSLVKNANEWAAKFFERGAIPSIILETEGQIPDPEMERIRTTWEKFTNGVRNAWRAMVLRNGMKANVIGMPIKDLAMPELEQTKKQQILAAHLIPPGLGDSSTNRATQEWLDWQFWTYTIIPELRTRIRPTLDKQLLNPMGLRIRFQTSEIEAIQREEIAKAESAQFVISGVMLPMYEKNVVSIAEVRSVATAVLQMADLPALELEFQPEERTPPPQLVQAQQGQLPPERQQAEDQPQPGEQTRPKALAPGGGPPPEVISDLCRWRDKALRRGKPVSFNDSSVPEWMTAEIDAAMATVGVEDAFSFLKQSEAARRRIELRVQRALEEIFERHQVLFVQAIENGEQPDYLALEAELRAAVVPALTRALTDEALMTSVNIGIGFDPAMINQHALEWARNYGYDLVSKLTDTTRKLVSQTVATFIETPGMTQQDVMDLLRPAFGQARAEMIATTEITRAYSAATNEIQRQLNQTGLPMVRVWHTSNDELVCPICGPLDGMPEAEWSQRFGLGPPAHVNCRCAIGLEIADA